MYQFPETVFTSNAPFVQLEHIKTELSELTLAYDKESIERVAVTLNVAVAGSTTEVEAG